MTPTTRILLLVTLLAGCMPPRDREAQIQRCHANGYSAHTEMGYFVHCCSVLNGDDVCLDVREITKHRRQTGQ